MNKKEINEIRTRFSPDHNNVTCIRGCYVNEKREIVSVFDQSLLSLAQEEGEKYLSLFKRALSGQPGRNLVDIVFDADQVMDGAEHKLLTALRSSALRDEEAVSEFYQRVIDSLQIEGNYLILLAHDAYDVPYRGRDEVKVDDASEEVFSYILCAVCPVKLTKPALSYHAEDNGFHERTLDWVVTSPDTGFMFPAFDDRASNIYGALYFTRDAAEGREDFVTALFGAEPPMPAVAQKEAFDALLSDTLEEDCRYDVVQTVNEQLRDMIEEHKADKIAEPLVISKREVRTMLESCGVSEQHVSEFESKYDEEFGLGAALNAQNIVNVKQFEVKTPDVVIRVSPDRSDLIETRVIDGVKYILIRADEGVEVNGINVNV